MNIIKCEFGKSYKDNTIKSICEIEFETFEAGLKFHQKLVALIVSEGPRPKTKIFDCETGEEVK